MDKISALKNMNSRIELLINNLSNDSFMKNRPDIIKKIWNNEETVQFYKYYKNGLKKVELNDNVFTRIVCVSGRLNIQLDMLNEEYILSSPNTLLIPPSVKFTLEALEDSELIYVYREKKQKNENVSIYKQKEIKNEQYIK